MAQTATETLPRQQRAVLNYLGRQPNGRALINDVQSNIWAPEDVIMTASGNAYIILRDGDGSPTVRFGNAYQMGLTAKGRRWLTTDPANRLVLAVTDAPRMRLKLHDALAADFSRDLLLDVVGSGLLTLHYAGDGRQTHFDGNGRVEFGCPRDFDIRPTAEALRGVAL